MARPVKKTQHQWKNEILNAAQNLFITKGYQKHNITGEMLYPCELYQATEQNTDTEQNIGQNTEQKADET